MFKVRSAHKSTGYCGCDARGAQVLRAEGGLSRKPRAGLNNVSNVDIVVAKQVVTTGANPVAMGKGFTMKMSVLGAAALVLVCMAGAASAGPIDSACMSSQRKAVTRSLCGCIQQVANQTLPGADQRRVATFFRDPEKAQKVRLSDSRVDDAFWLRYKEFGAQAEAVCAG